MRAPRQWLRPPLFRWPAREQPAEAVRRYYAALAQTQHLSPGDAIQRANDAALALCVPRAPDRGVALDVGCGTGRHQVLLRARGWERLFGFDLVPEMLARASGYAGLAVAELHKLPARPVELVLCSMVLGHVARLEPALDALARLVRYRGHLVLSELHPRALAAGVLGQGPRPKARRALEISEVVAALHARGLSVQLVTEPAPEPPLAREPPHPMVPLVYALCARRVAG